MDQTAGEEINCLDPILTISNIAATNIDHANNCVEDGRLEKRSGGQSYSHDGAIRAHISHRLLEGTFSNGEQDDSMGAEAFWRGSLDISDHVAGFDEINVGL